MSRVISVDTFYYIKNYDNASRSHGLRMRIRRSVAHAPASEDVVRGIVIQNVAAREACGQPSRYMSRQQKPVYTTQPGCEANRVSPHMASVRSGENVGTASNYHRVPRIRE